MGCCSAIACVPGVDAYVAYGGKIVGVAGTRTAHCAARSTGKAADRETRAANAVSGLLVRPREDV